MDSRRQLLRRRSEIVAARSFCELFAARCIDVAWSGDPRNPHRVYRALGNLDTSLLKAAERIVVRCLESFTSYRLFLRRAARMLERELPDVKQQLSVRNEELILEAEVTIDDALEYHPPTSSCSV